MKKSELRKLPQVGKGFFTRCYALNDSTVLIETYDPVKRIMAEGKFPKTKLFPKVERCKNPFGIGGDFYTMPYYKGRPTRSTQKWLKDNLKPYHFTVYKELYALEKEVRSKISGKKGIDRQPVWNDAFDSLENKKLSSLLKDAYNACCDVADNIMFECQPRNVIYHEGNLILLDCFFSSALYFEMRFSTKPVWALNWV